MKTNNNRFLFLDYIAFVIIVIAFFIISYCGFFTWDDIYMNYGVSTLSDVLEHTKMFYFTYGGRLFSVASQYLFSGVLGNNRVWFAIANTLVFTSLMMVCGGLITGKKEGLISRVLLFALLFWFLCPVPSETLFLTAASTTYLWANTLSFVFLWFYLKYKDDNFGVVGKMGLFFMSVLAATEFITCASICGAFVVYYAFHIKKFKGNAVPFVAGFAIGSMVMLFAPGNFERVSLTISSVGSFSLLDNVQNLVHHPVNEILKFKVLWLFVIVLACGGIKNKEAVKLWMKNNAILLLSLGWSIIAFSMVFNPHKRALFFPEILSLVLLLRFFFDDHVFFGMRFLDNYMSNNRIILRNVIIILLFVMFVVDSAFAIVETKKQSYTNDELMNELVDSGGIVVWDRVVPSHRMAYCTRVAPWSVEPLAKKYGLDSVNVYPYYCLDKYYKQAPQIEDIYIDKDYYDDEDDILGKFVPLIVRLKTEELKASDYHVTFTIDYTRPKKWYKLWLDKLRNYQYDRTEVIEIDDPEVCYDGYCYYIIWLGKENSKNLKSVKYEIL